ncbi:uncharacterized protein KY384_000186 [Bacidia gigantensis]|uniref:uncharacterized protein n=1 Tax=Bacidia gigantensis TaxID=2732470 RepID=UPI001D0493F4|nr:uncharacterized protein KY384_000186 [Bacidia gigantensis]KAG8526193.1 hypothetical protein KY384_000186 [Bacidia gigantensis]
MDPPQPSSTAAANEAAVTPTQNQPVQPVPPGQSHDRMETDEDSDDTRSETGRNTPEQSESTPETAPQPAAVDGEPMDTTQDPPPVTVAPTSTQPPPPAATETTNTINNILRIGMTANISMGSNGIATLLDTPTFSLNMNGIDQQSGNVQVTIPTGALESIRASRQPPPPQREDSVESRRRERREEREREREEDRDDSSESSSDDEENPYWASFKEDTSSPDEREIQSIEEAEKNLPLATDHEHWEKTTFESIDDPEYIPDQIGRISWTLKGVHGTPDKPNKERIMRSPSVKIGDYYWSIKYYPRGNDGTEQVSVYLECSPKSNEEVEKQESEQDKDKENVPPVAAAPLTEGEASDTQMSSAPMEESQTLPDAGSTTTEHPATTAQPVQSQATEATPDSDKPWRVPAQVCCVMYNPNEPRVYVQQKSAHSYYNENPDWGWTRFHGPWDDLHQRKRFQRQAMLRNDTLAFTVYIRTFKDETNALWWHAPKDKAAWDSIEMTGVRAFKCVRPDQSSAVISALSTWLHLTPILNMIREAHIPDCFTEPDIRPRPLLEELRAILEETGEYSDKTKELSLSLISTLMDVNSFDGIRKMDVVALWEHLRRLLTFEDSNASSLEEACNSNVEAFKDILLLKQPDLFNLDPQSRRYQPEGRDVPAVASTHEPTSVQEAVDLASQHLEKAFRAWECFPQQRQELSKHPKVLQIELHRQHFDQADRKWMKLGHKIALDEQITFSNASYTLYGIIVHNGSLESQEFYSVIRPAGPKTRWLKYSGESNSRKVSVLTTKQATTAHEGSGPPVLDKKSSASKIENAAVAYVVMYALTDSLKSILETPFDRKLLDSRKTQSTPELQAVSNANSETTSAPSQEKPPVQVSVYFYCGDAFSGTDEIETFDPWSERIRNQSEDVCQITLPETVKVEEVKKILDHILGKHKDTGPTKPVNIWLLDSRKPCLGSSPAFYSFERHKEEALEVVPQFSEGCRFWLGGQDLAIIRKVLQQLKNEDPMLVLEEVKKAETAAREAEDNTPPVVDQQSTSTTEGQAVAAQATGENASSSIEPPAPSQQVEEQNATATVPTTPGTSTAPAATEATTASNATETATSPLTTGSTSEPVVTESAAVPQSNTTEGESATVPSQTNETPTQEQTDAWGDAHGTSGPPAIIAEENNGLEASHTDVVMTDAHDNEVQPPPPQPTASQPRQTSKKPPKAAVRQVFCFLKVFDWENQTLSSTASFSAPLASSVLSEIMKAMGVEKKPNSDDEMTDADQPESEPEQWDVYHERFQFSKAYDLVTSNMTFDNFTLSTEFLPGDIQIIVPTDGACFIAQRRPNEEQISALIAAGKPTTVSQYISHLLAQTYHPAYSVPQRTTSYLGSNYFSGSQSYSRPHGQGTLVTMTGDTYTGPFTSGLKSGPAGKMIFANKDTYEGAWEHDEPSGQGQMMYAKTGNVYEGGWKKGKRHGQGTMKFEVADEEMKLCQVCYEEEMDRVREAGGELSGL